MVLRQNLHSANPDLDSADGINLRARFIARGGIVETRRLSSERVSSESSRAA